MQQFMPIPSWKEAPFVRLIIPFIAGILIQWHSNLPAFIAWILLILSLLALLIFSYISMARQFRHAWWNGIWLHALLVAAGQLLCFYQNTARLNSRGINNYFTAGNTVVATIEEPLSAKTRTMKAIASVRAIRLKNGTIQTTKGNILLYFQKDSTLRDLQYGNQIVFTRPLQPIQNSGNPGAFNYQRYCAFQQIYYQVYLKPGEYVTLKIQHENVLKKFLFATREKTIDVLKRYIHGDKEAGLAEAMLIGYKNNLDKDLVRSYSNTGVVHIIAISGLHLGLIYGLLTLLLQPISRYQSARWLQPITIIAGLWLFSLVAGSSPSVLRSAVMFTCLVIGRYASRQPSTYNTLAASAFLLLCYDPFWLWDAGFQLSYAAVLSILLYMKPVYDCCFMEHKLLNAVWKLTAITLAAQVLTLPVSVYHFHQFPNLFLFANLLAVPLSGVILIGELLLCAFSFIPDVATGIGILLQWTIRLLNSFIENMNRLPFTTLDHLQINLVQVCAAYLLIAGIAAWLLHGKKQELIIGLLAGLLFAGVRCWSLWQACRQQKLVVYNVPQRAAMDIICGRQYLFIGDSALLQDDAGQLFHLQPARTLYRVYRADSLVNLFPLNQGFVFGNRSVVRIDKKFSPGFPVQKIAVDILILSKNPAVTINQLTRVFACKQIVFDSSNPAWKIARWKSECQQQGVVFYSVPDEGAFVLNGY
jgi:competence protein ComEC